MRLKSYHSLIYLSCFIFVPRTVSTDEVEDDNVLEGLEKGRTRRMLWLDKKRNLILPPGTALSVTPILAFPMFKQSATWVSFENLEISWTFFLLFQGLGWTSEQNAWPLDLSFLFSNMTPPLITPRRRYDVCSKKNRERISGCGKSIPVMSLPTHVPGGERASLIPYMEKFVDSFGFNGRACLQRAVCEVHEIPLKNGFGLLGELITLLFSISESIFAKSHLPGYLNAEKAGKYGDCSKFNGKCPHSIFTSK